MFEGYAYWNNKVRRVEEGGRGLDCSGLVHWAFNRANDSTASRFNNVVVYEGADGQYRNNTEETPVAANDLAPGDLLFFSADGDPDTFKEHVAMYVGGEGEFDVVEAFDPQTGIIKSMYSDLAGSDEYIGQVRRLSNANIKTRIQAGSPIDIALTDPDGITITPDTFIQTDEEFLREVPGAWYYSEMVLGEDGAPADALYSPHTKNGRHIIRVIPHKDVAPDDTYSLTFTIGSEVHVLAESEPISSIPLLGFRVDVAGERVELVAPTPSDILQELREVLTHADTRTLLHKRIDGNLTLIERFVEKERPVVIRVQVQNLTRLLERQSGNGIDEDSATRMIALLEELLLLLKV